MKAVFTVGIGRAAAAARPALQMLAVGETDVHQGNVLVAVAGVRVQLTVIQKRVIGLCELDGLLRAVLNAGEFSKESQ